MPDIANSLLNHIGSVLAVAITPCDSVIVLMEGTKEIEERIRSTERCLNFCLHSEDICVLSVSLGAPISSIRVKRHFQSLKGEKIMFKRNEGILDRIVRVALGLVLVPLGLILLGVLQGNVPGLVIAGLGGLALITGITGFCPLYLPFGINTREKEIELFDKFRVTMARVMDRCMSMMAGFRQGPVDPASPSPEFISGPCLPSKRTTRNQQE